MKDLAHVVHEWSDGILIARILGEVDVSNVEQVREDVSAPVTNTTLGIVVDLSETAYLDSSGIRLLFDLGRRLATRGQRLTVVVPEGAPIRRVLDIVRYRPLYGSSRLAVDELRRSLDSDAGAEGGLS